MLQILQPHTHGRSRSPWAKALAGAALAGLLGACASHGEVHTPMALTQPAALGLAADTPGAALPQPRWWTALGDAQLDTLVDDALQNQPSLAVARARAAQAAALADGRRAANGPQAVLQVDAARQRYTANGLVPPPVAGNVYDNFNVQAALSWSPDFFGLHRAELQAALGQARAAQAETASAANQLAMQLARSWVALARVLADQRVAQQALEQRQAMDRLTRERVNAGLDSQVELTQANAAVPEAAAQVEALAEQASLARRQIALLAGKAPDALSGLTPHLKTLTRPAVPKSLGADLLGRRPDVVAARWRVQAASQGVSAAQSEFYPNINLTAFVGLSALGLDNVFRGSSRQLGIAPALRLPIFDGGRLRAQLSGRESERDIAIGQYNALVLDAVKQAGDALASVQSLERQQSLQNDAQAGSEQAWRFAQERYGAGLGNYLIVLNTETQVLAQRYKSVALQARALDVRLVLMNALGGGWSDDTDLLQSASH